MMQSSRACPVSGSIQPGQNITQCRSFRRQHLRLSAQDFRVKGRGAAFLDGGMCLAHRLTGGGTDDAMLYRELATLRTDVPLAEQPDQLRWTGVDDRALSELAGRLGDFNLRIPQVRPVSG